MVSACCAVSAACAAACFLMSSSSALRACTAATVSAAEADMAPPSKLPLPLLLAPGEPSRSFDDGSGGCAAACSAAGAVDSGSSGVAASPLAPLAAAGVRVTRPLAPLRAWDGESDASAAPLASRIKALSTVVVVVGHCQWPFLAWPWQLRAGGAGAEARGRLTKAVDCTSGRLATANIPMACRHGVANKPHLPAAMLIL